MPRQLAELWKEFYSHEHDGSTLHKISRGRPHHSTTSPQHRSTSLFNSTSFSTHSQRVVAPSRCIVFTNLTYFQCSCSFPSLIPSYTEEFLCSRMLQLFILQLTVSCSYTKVPFMRYNSIATKLTIIILIPSRNRFIC